MGLKQKKKRNFKNVLIVLIFSPDILSCLEDQNWCIYFNRETECLQSHYNTCTQKRSKALSIQPTAVIQGKSTVLSLLNVTLLS